MQKLTSYELRELMNNKEMIRNISVIGQVNHGKSTITESLFARRGIIPTNPGGKILVTEKSDNQENQVNTIRSAGFPMLFYHKGQDYLFNLIDSPGHIDFSAEAAAALRITDGALVVVDCVEGVCLQTDKLLQQAMQERVVPVLMLNKVDRVLLELKLDGETIYRNFVRIIDQANLVVSAFAQEDVGDVTLSPVKGNVAFGSGKDGWAFTLPQFARLYCTKFKISEEAMAERLWGNNFYDPETKSFLSSSTKKNGKKFQRAFDHFILNPIREVIKVCASGSKNLIVKLGDSLGIYLTPEEKNFTGDKLMKTMLNRWINPAEALMELMMAHLPSPKKAQAYRTKYLYEGPEDDLCGTAMRECDHSKPLMIYVAKMVPSSVKDRFFALGRVFSGKVFSGQKVHILGPKYYRGGTTDLIERIVDETGIIVGPTFELIQDVPAGNIVALTGIDHALAKTSTISTYPASYCIRPMKYSVSPVVKVAVAPKNIAELPRLIAGMQRLSKSDLVVRCLNDQETGENFVCASSELHIEICLKDLVKEFANIEITRSDPIVAYRETVRDKSAMGMSKSVNHMNRLFCTAEFLADELVAAIEDGTLDLQNPKSRIKTLTEQFFWDQNAAAKIWTFGPDGVGPNIMSDATSGCKHITEIREHVLAGFEIVTHTGVLCDEPMRGVHFSLHEAYLHSDPIHRGGGQITPTTRRVLYAAELMADPTLQEPVFLVEIISAQDTVAAVYSCIASRRGVVEEEIPIQETSLIILKAFLPIAESFGFSSYLKIQTSGKAFPSCVFDHWACVAGSIESPESPLFNTIQTIRARKGLKLGIPELSLFLDKI